MASENEEMYRRGVDAFNRRDKDAWLQTVDPEIVSIPPREWPEPAAAEGADAVWEIIVANMGIFEDAELKVVGPIVEGEDTLVTQLAAVATLIIHHVTAPTSSAASGRPTARFET